MSKDIRINEALQILEPFFIRDSGKKLINLSSYNGPLGVPINNLDYKEALELILLKNNLIQTEAVGYIAIQDKAATDLGIGVETGKDSIMPTAEAVQLPEGVSPKINRS